VSTAIDRDRVRQLLAEGAQLLDVLSADEYEDAHLPEAVNIPLKRLGDEATQRLDRRRPVIVYCHDHL
jgi:rhodanese-related sulfurtransferase